MAENKSKKRKVLTSIAAIGIAASILLGGTYAWQSISQTAFNKASDVVNPGGRLHDDFNGTNKDVYVENFGDEEIIARIRLSEYLEIGKGAGQNFDDAARGGFDVITDGAVYGQTDTYKIHDFYEEYDADDLNQTIDYWNWITGSEEYEKQYVPTFNQNKDSLLADINGTYESVDPNTDERYSDYVDYNEVYAEGDLVDGYVITDADINKTDELEGEDLTDIIENGNLDDAYASNVDVEAAQNEVKYAGSATLMSIDEWLVEKPVGNIWVYDHDGWVYWANTIKGGEATGLLLNEIELAQVMDDSWYYEIFVTAQFVTPDDIGADDGTGFYADGETVSSDALELIEAITSQMDGENSGENTDEEEEDVYLDILVHEQYDDHWDTANYFQHDKEYRVYVSAYGDFTNEELLAATVNASLTATTPDGSEYALSDDDYTLTFPTGSFAEVGVEDEYGDTYIIGTLTLNDSIPYGTWINVCAETEVGEVSGSNSFSLILTQGLIDIDIELYDEQGQKVSDYCLNENSFYYVVGKVTYNGEEYTVFSGDETRWPLSSDINRSYIENDHYVLHSYEFEELSAEEFGMFTTGTNDPDFFGEITPAVCIDNLQILDSTGAVLTNLYAYGQDDWYFDYERPFYDLGITPGINYWNDEIESVAYTINVADHGNTFELYAEQFDSTVEDAVYKIISDVSEGTIINGDKLIIGDDETATRIVIKAASVAHKSQGYLYVDVEYESSGE